MNFDGTVLLIKNFISPEICKELADWSINNTIDFVDGISRDNGYIVRVSNRKTTRLSPNVIYPEVTKVVENKIYEILPFLKEKNRIEGHGNNGIVASITYDGGNVYEHLDPPVGNGLEGLRCNLLVSNANSGGTIYVSDVPYVMEVGDLQCYLVTKNRHRVDTCYGNPRIMFMFGWCIEEREIVNLCI